MEEQYLVGEEVESELSKTLYSVIAEGFLFIESSQRAPELYDLFADPANHRNLAGLPVQRSRQDRLKRMLDALRTEPRR